MSNIQTIILDAIVKRFRLCKEIAVALSVLSSLDEQAIVLFGLSKMGAYKYALFGVYFLVFA